MSGYCPDCGNTICICKEVESQENERSVEGMVGKLVAMGNLKDGFRMIGEAVTENAGPILDAMFLPLCLGVLLLSMLLLSLMHWSMGFLCLILLLQLAILAKK